MRISAICLLAVLAGCASPPPPPPTPADPFPTPVMEHWSDPQAVLVDGVYYAARSIRGQSLELRRTRDLTAIAAAEAKIVWTPPPGLDHSQQLWAPEVHRIDGAWYIDYAASDGDSDHHHLYVLENASPDPFTGAFTLKARLQTDPADCWAIDATVFEFGGSRYMAWSGWAASLADKTSEETARIYIARMANPWTLATPRVEISRPEHEWERQWRNPPEWKKTPGRPVYVNEGPAAVVHGGRLYVAYSASGCWTPSYCVGLLSLRPGGDPLNPADWSKAREPIFRQDPGGVGAGGGVYGPGHGSFVPSPDGREDWFLYHASDKPEECGGWTRSARLQRVRWTDDGPSLGTPAARSVTPR